MLQIKPLSDQFSVSPQILLDDLPAIAKLGFKSVINNRPDGEESDQPGNNQFKEKCLEIGLEYQYIPVISNQISKKNILDMSDYMGKMTKPIFAFCRTGTRSCSLWLGGAQDSATLADRVDKANAQGYQIDLSQIPLLSEE